MIVLIFPVPRCILFSEKKNWRIWASKWNTQSVKYFFSSVQRIRDILSFMEMLTLECRKLRWWTNFRKMEYLAIFFFLFCILQKVFFVGNTRRTTLTSISLNFPFEKRHKSFLFKIVGNSNYIFYFGIEINRVIMP